MTGLGAAWVTVKGAIPVGWQGGAWNGFHHQAEEFMCVQYVQYGAWPHFGMSTEVVQLLRQELQQKPEFESQPDISGTARPCTPRTVFCIIQYKCVKYLMKRFGI